MSFVIMALWAGLGSGFSGIMADEWRVFGVVFLPILIYSAFFRLMRNGLQMDCFPWMDLSKWKATFASWYKVPQITDPHCAYSGQDPVYGIH